MGRGAGLRVSPDLRLAYVESVNRQPVIAFRVRARPSIDEIELERDVVPGRSVVGLELARPPRVVHVEHVDPIKPHLVGVVGIAVVEAAGGRAVRAVDLRLVLRRGRLVYLVARGRVQVQPGVPVPDVVDGVAVVVE